MAMGFKSGAGVAFDLLYYFFVIIHSEKRYTLQLTSGFGEPSVLDVVLDFRTS